MKQHTVPQNIMSVEFKIFGDLSIRQFIYVSIAGGLSFILYLIGLPGILKIPLIVFFIIAGLLITFGKVNERPFDQWISSFITAIMLPTQRIWSKDEDFPEFLLDAPTTAPAQAEKKDEGYSKVISFLHSRRLPTDDVYKSNTKLDIEEIKILSSIDKLIKNSVLENKLKSFTPPASTSFAQVNDQQSVGSVPQDDQAQLPPLTPPMAVQPNIPQQPQPQPEPVSEKEEIPVMPTPEKPDTTKVNFGNSSNLINQLGTDKEGVVTIEPNTVVKFSDLKNITSISQSLDDALKRMSSVGEDDEENIEKNVEETPTQPEVKETPIPMQMPASSFIAPHMEDESLKKLEAENEKLRKELIDLKHQSEVSKSQPKEPIAEQVQQAELDKTKLFGHMPDFVKFPNIISGVVVDSNGKLLEDVVIIVKKSSGSIMRALKTNLLGQFYSRNPFLDGTYNIEANKVGYVFNVVSVSLKGEVIEPVIIRPKVTSENNKSLI